MSAVDPLERIMGGVRKGAETDCWEWTRYVSNKGYGITSLRGKNTPAHRAIYELLVGPIPKGRQLDHLCRNRSCVNPAHLEVVTCRENLLRGDTIAARRAAQTHCKRGQFTSENTYTPYPNGRGCRKCHAAKNWGYKHGLSTDEVLALREGAA